MKTRHRMTLACSFFLLFSQPLIAQERLPTAPNEAVIKVSGAVCSFCTLGIQKNLSKLPFIDTAKYNKGSIMDIENQRLTIAIQPSIPLDLKQVYQAIVDGGYDPQGAAVNVSEGATVHYDDKGLKCAIPTSPC